MENKFYAEISVHIEFVMRMSHDSFASHDLTNAAAALSDAQ